MTPPAAPIGPYQIAREIGRGGMGVVYLARDTKLGRDVAIKALPEDLASDADRLARFEREARALAQLNHTNIAGIHGIEEQGGRKFLILEYVEGETLGDRLERGPVPFEEAMEIAAEIAGGVEAAHEAGIVHRDLKPDNIKITPQGRVKVLDFGLARTEETSGSATEIALSPTLTTPRSPTVPGAVLGTAPYMSPEQARGRRVDRRTDIWSFGVILYEMLTGLSPFAGETAGDSIGAILHKAVDLDRLPPSVPPLVRHLLQRCLERDHRRRLRDIGDARLELEAARSGASLGAAGATSAVSRRSVPAVVFVLGILAAVVLSAGVTWMALPRAAVAPAPTRMLEIAVPGLDHHQPQSAVVSPDGTRVVYSSQGHLWVRALDADAAVALEGTEGGGVCFWSPDSREIGFAIGRDIYRMPAAGGSRTRICRAPIELWLASGVTWADSDRLFVTAAESEPIWACAVADGRLSEVLVPDGVTISDFHDVSALPDDAGVLTIRHKEGGLPDAILLLRDGSTQTVLEHPGEELFSPRYDPSSRHLLYTRAVLEPGIWAVPFSVERGAVTGDPFRVYDAPAILSVSRNGLLVFSDGVIQHASRNTRRTELVWVDRTGKIVESIEGTLAGMNAPAVSPDGRYVVVMSTEGGQYRLWVTDLQRGVRSPIYDLGTDSDSLGWLPDGRVLFNENWKTYAIAADGLGEPTLIANGDRGTISRDGRLMAMEARAENPSDTWDVIVTDLQDKTRRVVVGGPSYQTFPTISSDGRWLLYSSADSGAEQVWLTRLPEADQRWQVSRASGTHPRFSADGREVLFVSADTRLASRHASMMAVSLQTEPEVRLGTPTRLFGDKEIPGLRADARYDIHPDGDRFLMVREVEQPGRAERIMVFENWIGVR